MISLIMKFLSIPTILWAVSLMNLGVYYPSMYQPLLIGLVISVIGRLAEKVLFKPGTIWISIVADAVLAVLIIYYSQRLFPGARITWGGAVVTSLIIGIVEYIVHVIMVNQTQQEV